MATFFAGERPASVMEFDRKTTWLIFAGIIVLATVALLAAPMMSTSTVLTMVLPSMVVFGVVLMWLGIQHGQYLSHP
jgi:uncharacterized membrane protein HdeD (DUF308 family)